MQCTGYSRCFPQEKAGSHSTALPNFLSLLVFFMCVVFSCFHTISCEAYSFTTDGYEIVNVRTNAGECRTLEGVGHKDVCTRVDSRGQKHCWPPCPARESNPGSLDFNSDALSICSNQFTAPQGWKLWSLLPRGATQCVNRYPTIDSYCASVRAFPAASIGMRIVTVWMCRWLDLWPRRDLDPLTLVSSNGPEGDTSPACVRGVLPSLRSAARSWRGEVR